MRLRLGEKIKIEVATAHTESQSTRLNKLLVGVLSKHYPGRVFEVIAYGLENIMVKDESEIPEALKRRDEMLSAFAIELFDSEMQRHVSTYLSQNIEHFDLPKVDAFGVLEVKIAEYDLKIRLRWNEDRGLLLCTLDLFGAKQCIPLNNLDSSLTAAATVLFERAATNYQPAVDNL